MSTNKESRGIIDPKSPYTFLVNMKQTRGYLRSIKVAFKNKDGIWFGCLDDEGKYGIATTVEEVRYAVVSYYQFVKGTMANASLLVKNARTNGILPSGFEQVKMLMPNFDHKEENANKSN
jgi:hypothetical protein